MQTSSSNTPRPLGPLAPPTAQPVPNASQREASANLFATELERASGRDGSGEGQRAERQTARSRRAAQAEKADTAQAERTESRTERGSAETTRREARAERLARRAEATQPAPRTHKPAATRATEPKPPAPAKAPAAQATAPTAPDREPAAETPTPPGLPTAPIQAPAAQVPTAPTHQPSQANQPAQAAAPTAAAAPSNTGGQTQDPGAGQTQRTSDPATRERATGPRQATTFRDLVSELMVAREADLDRQASILRQVQSSLSPNGREVSIQLSPAALGQIQMRIALREGRLTAVMRAAKPETLEALQNQLPELTASLEAQGFDVVDFDLDLLQD